MNKFGRSLPSGQKGVKVLQTPNVISFTQDGNFNMRDHRLCNVSSPMEDADAVNKIFLDTMIVALDAKIDHLESVGKSLKGSFQLDCEECLGEVQGQLNSVQLKLKQALGDVERQIDSMSDANKKYCNSMVEQLHDLVKSLSESIIDLKASYNNIDAKMESYVTDIKDRFTAVNVKFEDAKITEEKIVENLKPEFDKFENLLKVYIDVVIPQYLEEFTVELKKISDIVQKHHGENV